MDTRNIIIGIIVIIISPFILIPHVIYGWLPEDFFYEGKRSKRFYSFDNQTLCFEEYGAYYVLSYIVDGKAVEKYSWNYHDMNSYYRVFVHFSDSTVEVSNAELYEQIKGSENNRKIIINPEGEEEWVNKLIKIEWSSKFSIPDKTVDLPDSNFRRCCRIETNIHMDNEDKWNDYLRSDVKRVIKKNKMP